MTACWSCLSNSGERRISPGPTIYEGRDWLLEHAYPTSLKGWLVVVLRRHAEALHELSEAEFAELASIQARATRLLADLLGCEKEYAVAFAEAEHFHHVHVHLIPRMPDLPPSYRGSHIFKLLNVPPEKAVPPDEVAAFCRRLRAEFG